jgi:hypothetical protein
MGEVVMELGHDGHWERVAPAGWFATVYKGWWRAPPALAARMGPNAGQEPLRGACASAIPAALKWLDAGVDASDVRWLAAALGRVRHPGLLAVDGCVESSTDGRQIVIMEPVSGVDLPSFMRKAEMTEALRASVVADVAGGLAAMHEAHLVHGGVEPRNILITPEGRAKLGGFHFDRTDVVARQMDDVFALGLTIWSVYARREPTTTTSPPATYQLERDTPAEVVGWIDSCCDQGAGAHPTAAQVEAAFASPSWVSPDSLSPVTSPGGRDTGEPDDATPPAAGARGPHPHPLEVRLYNSDQHCLTCDTLVAAGMPLYRCNDCIHSECNACLVPGTAIVFPRGVEPPSPGDTPEPPSVTADEVLELLLQASADRESLPEDVPLQWPGPDHVHRQPAKRPAHTPTHNDRRNPAAEDGILNRGYTKTAFGYRAPSGKYCTKVEALRAPTHGHTRPPSPRCQQRPGSRLPPIIPAGKALKPGYTVADYGYRAPSGKYCTAAEALHSARKESPIPPARGRAAPDHVPRGKLSAGVRATSAPPRPLLERVIQDRSGRLHDPATGRFVSPAAVAPPALAALAGMGLPASAAVSMGTTGGLRAGFSFDAGGHIHGPGGRFASRAQAFA